jgi:hypothetical protein
MQRMMIVGMGRSGTTYLTEFLGKCGVFLDEVNWAYEHELARLVNDSVLVQEFGAKPGLPYGRLPAKEIKLSDSWHTLARFFIKYMDSQAKANSPLLYWAFKDPRTTILHDIWLDHFDIIIGMFRAPQEVVASYLGQGWIKGLWRRRQALQYWKRFNRSLLYIYQTCKGKKPVYILDYNGDIIEQTTLLCKKLGISLTEEARSLFDSSRKHYNHTELPRDKEAVEIYQTLRSIRMITS